MIHNKQRCGRHTTDAQHEPRPMVITTTTIITSACEDSNGDDASPTQPALKRYWDANPHYIFSFADLFT
jgi:hypothetical protein